MNPNDFPKLEDLSTKEFRAIARELAYMNYGSTEYIFKIFKKLSTANTEILFDLFIKNNLIELNKDKKWESTLNLRSIAGASLTKRKKEKDAWLEVAKLIARTVVLAQSSDWSRRTPSNLYLFGSMLDKNKTDYGDADLVLCTNIKEDLNELNKKQKNWLNNYLEFTSSTCVGTYGFREETQLKIDMKTSSSFFSIHDTYEIESLSELNPDFPLLSLWKNPLFKEIKNDDNLVCEDLCEKWKAKNINTHNACIEKLNTSFKILGIVKVDDEKFTQSCEQYIKKILKDDLIKKISNNSDDAIVTNRAVRFGENGVKAILEAVKEIPPSDLTFTKLDMFLDLRKHELKRNKKMKLQ